MIDGSALPQRRTLLLPRSTFSPNSCGGAGAALDLTSYLAISLLTAGSYAGWDRVSTYGLDAAMVTGLVFLLIGKVHGHHTFAALARPARMPSALLTTSFVGSTTCALFGGAPTLEPHRGVTISRPPLGRLERAAKSGFDFIAAGAALALLAPVILMLAALVRATSPGPAIFKQTRRGFNGREFQIWKLRTMRVGQGDPGLRQAERNDTRVTPFGRWLRRTSLDELPQLVNVLRGEMSLIGPRPHALAHDDAYSAAIQEYVLRRRVKPGLTGVAQAEGLRGETRTLAEMQARVTRDLWYIDNWSASLDVRIAFCTLFALFKYEAY